MRFHSETFLDSNKYQWEVPTPYRNLVTLKVAIFLTQSCPMNLSASFLDILLCQLYQLWLHLDIIHFLEKLRMSNNSMSLRWRNKKQTVPVIEKDSRKAMTKKGEENLMKVNDVDCGFKKLHRVRKIWENIVK